MSLPHIHSPTRSCSKKSANADAHCFSTEMGKVQVSCISRPLPPYGRAALLSNVLVESCSRYILRKDSSTWLICFDRKRQSQSLTGATLQCAAASWHLSTGRSLHGNLPHLIGSGWMSLGAGALPGAEGLADGLCRCATKRWFARWCCCIGGGWATPSRWGNRPNPPTSPLTK